MPNSRTTTNKATLEILSLQFKLICFILKKNQLFNGNLILKSITSKMILIIFIPIGYFELERIYVQSGFGGCCFRIGHWTFPMESWICHFIFVHYDKDYIHTIYLIFWPGFETGAKGKELFMIFLLTKTEYWRIKYSFISFTK